MNSAGLWMLAALGALVVFSGLPVWALLIGVASGFAAIGLAAGQFDLTILAAAPSRVLNLLEHDLLQAMPLYVFVGVLLQRLPLADALYGSAARLLRGTGAAPSLAGLAVGALVAPMNGSVASSSALLSRLVAPRLRAIGPGRAIALVSVAATIGVVVPPSLVLILLGDTMLRAHTEASNWPGFSLGAGRIINTQDVLHAALVPALCVQAGWAAVAWWQGRKADAAPPAQATPAQMALAIVTVLTILLLLGGVFTGRFLAVEAAAAGGCLLAVCTVATRSLDRAGWRRVLRDTLALSGALFALLAGAATFSLVFRLFGTDRWLADLALGTPWPPSAVVAMLLVLVALCAWVLDAFEMIFVIIPIVAPVLILKLGDAQQAAVLLLLVLQLSFLLPPMGYAVLMVRANAGLAPVRTGELLRALAPYVAVQLAVGAAVLAVPMLVHLLDAPAAAAAPAASEQDIVRQMEEMGRQAPADADISPPAPPPADEPRR